MSPESVEFNWPTQSALPELAEHEVQIWAVNLTRPSQDVQTMAQLLSDDELARAAKFHFDEDRAFYQFGRGLLRTLIGHYEQIAPETVVFEYGEQGKPELLDSDLQFNVSHAYGVALFGFVRGRKIGVDVELIRPLSDAKRVAKRSFSQEEYEVWTAVAATQKMQAFFNCWTRKEAYIKATGQGLSCPLGSFAVSLRPEDSAQLLHVNGSAADAAKWDLRSVNPAKRYVGAVLAEGVDWTLSQFVWPN